LNYKLIDKKPLKFYDQVLSQDVIKKKVYKERDELLQEYAEGLHNDQTPQKIADNLNKISRRMKDAPLQY